MADQNSTEQLLELLVQLKVSLIFSPAAISSILQTIFLENDAPSCSQHPEQSACDSLCPDQSHGVHGYDKR